MTKAAFSKMKCTKLLSIAILQYLLVLIVIFWTANAIIDEDETNDVQELPAIGKQFLS